MATETQEEAGPSADVTDLVQHLAAAAERTGMRIAVAESLTCGAVASTLGRGENASSWLAGGVVAYGFDVKVSVLGVDSDVDPCSSACAEQLARGVRELFGADVAVAATGVGGPEPDGPHAPGTVHLGWSDADGTSSTRHTFDGEPGRVIEQTVRACVEMLARGVARG